MPSAASTAWRTALGSHWCKTLLSIRREKEAVIRDIARRHGVRKDFGGSSRKCHSSFNQIGSVVVNMWTVERTDW